MPFQSIKSLRALPSIRLVGRGMSLRVALGLLVAFAGVSTSSAALVYADARTIVPGPAGEAHSQIDPASAFAFAGLTAQTSADSINVAVRARAVVGSFAASAVTDGRGLASVRLRQDLVEATWLGDGARRTSRGRAR